MKSILAIIVLYRMTADESASYRSLQEALRKSPEADGAIDIVLCDNTPFEQAPPAGFQGVYRRDLSNPGLAKCYNFALGIASDRHIPWLMLLDQDTTLTADYIREVVQQTRHYQLETGVVALVPKLIQNDVVQSPHTAPTFRHDRFDRTIVGLSTERLYAFNSGSLMKVEAIAAVGGFPEEFWLDFLDHAIFHRLQASGARIFILQACLDHDLSANGVERKDEISRKRYQNVLDAEHLFYRLYGSPSDKFYHRIRLLRGSLGTLIRKRRLADALQMLRAAVRI
jgi:GT2 family glycosyltransferase